MAVFVNNGRWSLYVDGSYHKPTDRSAYAFALVRYNICFFEEYGLVVDAGGTRNIAGELMAVKKGLDKINQSSPDPVTIYYDYTGIECWATGLWACNNPVTADYRRYIQQKMQLYDINFVKVRAHSGNPWNEHVDRLVRKAFLDDLLPT